MSLLKRLLVLVIVASVISFVTNVHHLRLLSSVSSSYDEAPSVENPLDGILEDEEPDESEEPQQIAEVPPVLRVPRPPGQKQRQARNQQQKRRSSNRYRPGSPMWYVNRRLYGKAVSLKQPPGHWFQLRPKDRRPPYSSLLERQPHNAHLKNVTLAAINQSAVAAANADILHFAIIGFGKCGTTTLMDWLGQNRSTTNNSSSSTTTPQLQLYPREIYDLSFGRIREFLHKIYSMPPGEHFLRGYKSPADVASPQAVQMLADYFPQTKLIVAVRHPVRWFESLYNFRVQNLNRGADHLSFPKPEELIGTCTKEKKNTCTKKGEFAYFVRQLGKTFPAKNEFSGTLGGTGKALTSLSYAPTAFERRLIKATRIAMPKITSRIIPNPLYIVELEQLKNNPEQVRRDLSDFLQVPLLPPMNVHYKPGRVWDPSLHGNIQEVKDDMKIDICQHHRVRKELMRLARVNSVWFRQYLLQSRPQENVHWTAGLDEAFRAWMVDPCVNETAFTKVAGSSVLGPEHWKDPSIW